MKTNWLSSFVVTTYFEAAAFGFFVGAAATRLVGPQDVLNVR